MMSDFKSAKDTKSELVRVVVRCRPMNEKENKLGYSKIVNLNSEEKWVEVIGFKTERESRSTKVFYFDDVYDTEAKTKHIFQKNASQLIQAVLEGFNATIFAYGQSGTGKTHTIEGDDQEAGIVPLAFDEIFRNILESADLQFLVRASFIEIYQDEIKDLLSKKSSNKCELKENKHSGTYVKNVTTFVCKSVDQLKKLMKLGKQTRCTGATELNTRSSRSHAVFTITVEITDICGLNKGRLRMGKLNLVDLAGSERQRKTNSEGQRLKEASKINLSLSALGNVISALAEQKGNYIPYRDSKLTRLLKDSLGGNSKTLVIANVGPSSNNYEETLNTLRFASRARDVRNKPYVNEDPADALLRKYQEEISRLKQELALRETARSERMSKKLSKCQSVGSSDCNFSLCSSKDDGCTINMKTDIDVEDSFNSLRNSNSFDEIAFLDELATRIKAMESKILSGSHNIVEYTDNQQLAIQVKTREIQNIKEREREIEELIELEDLTANEVKEGYSNLREEIGYKQKKLANLCKKLSSIRHEIADVQQEFHKDRDDLIATETDLVKELKLRFLIMESFIPKIDRREVLSRLYFDEEMDVWKIMPNIQLQLMSRPKSKDFFRRPVTDHVLISRRKVNHLYRCNKSQENLLKSSRYKVENILQLDMYKSESNVKNFESEKILYKLKHSFLNACKEENDLEIEAEDDKPQYYVHRKTQRLDHLRTTRINASEYSIPAKVYPKARGLVKK